MIIVSQDDLVAEDASSALGTLNVGSINAMFEVESTKIFVYLMDFAGNFGWNLIKNHEYIYI